MQWVDRYEAVKLAATALAAIDDLQAHLFGGLLIFTVALLLGLRPRPALAAVVLLEAVNELLDRIHYGSWRWSNTSGDIVATLAGPLLLFAVIETTRRWRDRRDQPAARSR